MSREQIEEMVDDIDAYIESVDVRHWYRDELDEGLAEALYNAGYRKQNEGHWFILEYEYFTCSECGYYHPNGCDSTKEAKEKLADGKVPKYCSDCGAKMKGGAE